jgi:hypothetical protein
MDIGLDRRLLEPQAMAAGLRPVNGISHLSLAGSKSG